MQRHHRGQVSTAFLLGLGVCVAGMFAADINAHSDTSTQNRPRMATSAENQFQRLRPSYAETIKQFPSPTPTPPRPFRPASCVGGWSSTTTLPDHNEVAAGGCDRDHPLASISIVNPHTGQSRRIGTLISARYGQGAVLVKSRWIYFIGGMGAGKRATKAVEVFDLATGKSAAAGKILQPRCSPLLTVLNDGHILVYGGNTCLPYPGEQLLLQPAPKTLELYDLRNGTRKVVGQFSGDRRDPTATLLINGRVLFTGGIGTQSQPVAGVGEIYDPKTNKLTIAGSMHTPRCSESIVTLVDGNVLFAGGIPCSIFPGSALKSAEIFDLSTNRFEKTGDMVHARVGAGVMTLRNGKILLAGGSTGTYEDVSQETAELYDPGDGKFTATGNMTQPRTGPMMTMRPDGAVLVVDGTVESLSISVGSRSSEIYDPAAGKFVAVTGKPN